MKKFTHGLHIRPATERTSLLRGPRRLGLAAAALLPIAGLATFVGTSVASPGAAADSPNLITNGSFETTTAPTSTYSTVLAGDSTTIQDWTVVTPAMYGPSGGSVDLTAGTYNGWGAEDGNYAIDLAGTSSEPGGIYQDVATTPGVEYSLSYWTAVNGDQAPGQAHTMDVVVGGVTVATIQAVSAGAPLQWVQQTTTVTATSSLTRVNSTTPRPGTPFRARRSTTCRCPPSPT